MKYGGDEMGVGKTAANSRAIVVWLESQGRLCHYKVVDDCMIVGDWTCIAWEEQ